MNAAYLAAMRAQAEAVKALADRATPGPWKDDGVVMWAKEGYWKVLTHRTFELPMADDAAFIAASREAVPALAQAVLDLIAEVDRLTFQLHVQEGVVEMLREAYKSVKKKQMRPRLWLSR